MIKRVNYGFSHQSADLDQAAASAGENWQTLSSRSFSSYVHVQPELTAQLQRALKVGDTVFAPVSIQVFPRFESVSPSECAPSSGYHHLPNRCLLKNRENIRFPNWEMCLFFNWRINDQCEFNVSKTLLQGKIIRKKRNLHIDFLHSTCTQTPQERRKYV